MKKNRQNLLISLFILLGLSTGVRSWFWENRPLCFWMKTKSKPYKYLATLGYFQPSDFYGDWYILGMTVRTLKKDCKCQIQSFEPPGPKMRPGTMFQGFIGCRNENRKVNLQAFSSNQYNTRFRMKYKINIFKNLAIWKTSQFWIVGRADDKSWMIITEPCRKKAMIIARTPKIDPNLYTELFRLLAVVYEVDITH